MRDEGDRFVAWRLDDAPAAPGADLEAERMERALLAYAHRSAARVGAEWFAAEFARRDEEERLQEARAAELSEALDAPLSAPSPEITLIDASVEDAVVGGAAIGLGLEPRARRARARVQPVAAEPATLEPVTAEPVTPEPVTPEPVTPEPVTPEPVTPEPVGADLVSPETPTPEATPQPAIRHPHVPRPPTAEPVAEPKRRRRRRKRVESAPSFVISAPEWARMSPGARRLYGLDASPNAAGTG